MCRGDELNFVVLVVEDCGFEVNANGGVFVPQALHRTEDNGTAAGTSGSGAMKDMNVARALVMRKKMSVRFELQYFVGNE